MSGPRAAIRLDKWLWHARMFKSRALAARSIAAGAVRVNAVRVTKPAAPVRVGDALTLVQGGAVRVLRVVALGSRRGPAVEAQGLYRELTGPGGADAPHDSGSGP
jgi:ribosome-associated heat shock protein Hsp15